MLGYIIFLVPLLLFNRSQVLLVKPNILRLYESMADFREPDSNGEQIHRALEIVTTKLLSKASDRIVSIMANKEHIDQD